MNPRRLLPLLLLALSAGCSAAAPGASEPAPMRVLVYNIHAGKDAGGERNLERVAEVVRASGSEVVFLQEVDVETERSGREDQLATLARLTGYHAAFGRAIDHQGGAYGVAVLSRWPIESDSMHLLPVTHAGPEAAGSYEARGVLHAVVRAPAGPLHLLATHLDASREDRYRIQQAAGVRALARAVRAGGEPVLVGGDFNSVPEGAAIAGMVADGWRDAWTECGSGPGATYPEDAPVRRIDYLFLPTTLSCASAEVLESQASDHRALLVAVTPR